MNINLLKGKMAEQGRNVDWLADEMGKDRSTMYRKLANPDKITIGEAKAIAALLGLTGAEACAIFLP